MSKPYLLISDTHYHAWSAFSEVLPDGMNSRLKILLDETRRAAGVLRDAGGENIVHAGDVFHTRGSLVPSVLNPVLDTYSQFTFEHLDVDVIAGNHDLESNTTSALTAAVSAMRTSVFVDSPCVSSTDGNAFLVNWDPDIDSLKRTIESTKCSAMAKMDLIIHAPVDGVIPGIPDHGLTPEYLHSLGFKRVFAGHYHNHKQFPGTNVYSIGALTHQTWSDVGSKAGFCLVYPDRVEWHASHAPSFVHLPDDAFESLDPDALLELVDGNYVRMVVTDPTAVREAEARRVLIESGAAGVLLRAPKVAKEARRDPAVTEGIESISEAVLNYARKTGPELAKLCEDIMKAVA